MDSAELESEPGERVERRASERSKVSLFARFMMPDKVEFPCQVINASPSSLAVISAHTGEIGTHCIFYITHLGRIEGHITRAFLGGFAVELATSERKREKIAAKIDWVVNHARYGTPEHRVHERKAPKNNLSEVFTPDGRSYKCKLLDISLSGAAMEMDVRFDLGSRLVLGGLEGIVVRQFEEGCAIEFLSVQKDQEARQRALLAG